MIRFLLVCLCLGSTVAQFFQCPTPPNAILNGHVGDLNCGDDGDPRPCMLTVQPGTSCTFTISPGDNSVNKWFGKLQIQATELDSNDQIIIVGAYDVVRNDILSPTFNLRSAFPYSGSQTVPIVNVTVTAWNNSTMQFGYYVQKIAVPAFTQNTSLSVAAGQIAQFIKVSNQDAEGRFWEIAANTSVAVSPADAYQASMPANLLNLWVYEGIGQNRKFLGSMYSYRERVWSLNSNQMTVQYVLVPLQFYYATVVVNDAANIAQCTTYNIGWVATQAHSTFLESYPEGGTYCYTLLNYPLPYPYYFLNVKTATPQEFPPTQLIAGGPVVDPVAVQTLLTTYSTSIDYPPILTSSATTFIVKTNSSSVYLAFDTAAPDNFHVAYPGRSGFITTPSYPNQNSLESVFFYMNGTSIFNTTLTVQNSLSPSAQLTVYGTPVVPLFKGPVNNSWSQSFADKMLDLNIDLGMSSSGGVFMTYTVSEAATLPLACPNGTANLQDMLSQDLTTVPANFECNFTFTYDANYFADVSVQSTNLSSGEVVQVRGLYDTIGNGLSDSNFNLRAAFPPNTVTLYVKTGATTSLRFGYSLRGRNISFSAPTVVTLGALQDAFYIQMGSVSKNSSWEINAKASSQVSAISASPSLSTVSDLLNFFVYEGTGPDMLLVGTLYQSYQKVWKSQGAAITVVYAQTGGLSTGAVIFNDAYNLESCHSYSAQWSYGNPTKSITTPDGNNITIDVTVDAGEGETACLTIVDDDSTTSDDPIFYDGYYNGWGYAKVFAGAPVVPFDDFPLRNLGSFFGKLDVGENNYFTLPQQFQGFARTIVLDVGLLQLSTTTDPDVANLRRAYMDRRGLVMSENYPFLSGSQDAAFSLRGDTPITVQFNIDYTNAPSDGSLLVYGEHEVILTVNLTDPAVTTTNYTVSALIVGFSLNGGDDPTNLNQGSLIRYQVVQSSQPATTMTVPTTSTAHTTRGVSSTAGVSSTVVSPSQSSTVVLPKCPPATLLNGEFGDSGCGDGSLNAADCGKLVQPNTKCTIVVNAPDSTKDGAQLNLVASGMNQQDDITIIYLFGQLIHNAQETTWNVRAGFPFPGTEAPILQIVVTASVNSTMKFGYNVLRFTPSFTTGSQLSVPVGQPAQFVQLKDSNAGDYWEVTTTSQVTLASGVSPTTSKYDLLNFWLYEGIGKNRTLIGNAFISQFLYTHTATSQATIMNALVTTDNMTATLIFNDIGNLQNCHPYVVEWVQDGNYNLSMTDNNIATACITVLNDDTDPSSLYLIKLTAGSDPTMPYNGTIRLSTGAPVQDPVAAGTFLASYGLPALPGRSTSAAMISLSFVKDAQSAQDHVPFTSRSGFIMSNYYTFNMPNQNAFFYMNPTSPFTFNLTIANSMSPAAVINVYGARGSAKKIAVTNGSVYSFTDTLIDLDIEGGAGPSGGVLLNYVVGDVANPTTAQTQTPQSNGNVTVVMTTAAPSTQESTITQMVTTSAAPVVTMTTQTVSVTTAAPSTQGSTATQMVTTSAAPAVPTTTQTMTVTTAAPSTQGSTVTQMVTASAAPAVTTTTQTVTMTTVARAPTTPKTAADVTGFLVAVTSLLFIYFFVE